MEEKESIILLAEKCLSEKGFDDVGLLLLENKIDTAKIYLLGAIDSLWTKKQISDNEAAEAYKVLEIDPEEASKLRQSSQLW